MTFDPHQLRPKNEFTERPRRTLLEYLQLFVTIIVVTIVANSAFSYEQIAYRNYIIMVPKVLKYGDLKNNYVASWCTISGSEETREMNEDPYSSAAGITNTALATKASWLVRMRNYTAAYGVSLQDVNSWDDFIAWTAFIFAEQAFPMTASQEDTESQTTMLNNGVSVRFGPVYMRQKRVGEDGQSYVKHPFNYTLFGKTAMQYYTDSPTLDIIKQSIGYGKKTATDGFTLHIPRPFPHLNFSKTTEGLSEAGETPQCMPKPLDDESCYPWHMGMSNITSSIQAPVLFHQTGYAPPTTGFQALPDEPDPEVPRNPNAWIHFGSTKVVMIDFLSFPETLVSASNGKTWPTACRIVASQDLYTAQMWTTATCSNYPKVDKTHFAVICVSMGLYFILHGLAIRRVGFGAYLSQGSNIQDLLVIICLLGFLIGYGGQQIYGETNMPDDGIFSYKNTVAYINGSLLNFTTSFLGFGVLFLYANVIRHLDLLPLTQLPLYMLKHAGFETVILLALPGLLLLGVAQLLNCNFACGSAYFSDCRQAFLYSVQLLVCGADTRFFGNHHSPFTWRVLIYEQVALVCTLICRFWVKGVVIASMVAAYSSVKDLFGRQFVDIFSIRYILWKLQTRPLKVWLSSEGIKELMAGDDDNLGLTEETLEDQLRDLTAKMDEMLVITTVMRSQLDSLTMELQTEELSRRVIETERETVDNWGKVVRHLDCTIMEQGMEPPPPPDIRSPKAKKRPKVKKDESSKSKGSKKTEVAVYFEERLRGNIVGC